MKQAIQVLKLFACSAAALPTWAAAQDVPSSGSASAKGIQPATTAAAASGLEEIVVTAQRRSERLQDVPIAVTAVTERALQTKGIRGTDDLNLVTPGLSITRVAATPLIYIRGIGTQSTTAAEEPANAIYIDGVYQTNTVGLLSNFYDVERIEVLKGPQGTLFGRNATGGLIHIITKDPSFEPAAHISLSYGNYDTREGSAYATTGLGEKVAVNASIYYYDQQNGWGQNRFNGEDVNRGDQLSARGKLLFQLDERTKLILSGNYTRNRSDIGSARQAPPGATQPGGFAYTGDFYDVNLNFSQDSNVVRTGVTGTLTHDLHLANLTVISSYLKYHRNSRYDQDATPLTLASIPAYEFARPTTHEIQISSQPHSRITWIGGLYYFHTNVGYDPLTIITSAAVANRFSDQKTNSYAAYGQASIPIFSKTNLTIGGRYTVDRRHITGGLQTNGGPITAIDQRGEWKRPTWRISLDRKLTDDILVYASYNRGFKSGTFNTSSPADPSVRPEKLDAYEVGLKSDLFDRHVRLNLSGYYYDYSNIQLQQTTTGGTRLLNAAKGRIYGAEAELTAIATTHVSFNGALTVTNSRYTSFTNAPSINPITRAALIVDASGNDMIRTPHWTLNLGTNYTIPLSSGSLSFSANYFHSDGLFTEPDNRLRINAYDIANGEIAYSPESEKWKARLWAKNLFGKKYFSGVSSTAGLGDSFSAAAPRTYGGTLEVFFR